MASNAQLNLPIDAFLNAPSNEVLGALAEACDYNVDLEQRNAWLAEIQLLRRALRGINGQLLLEFRVPRVGGRIDAVVIAGAAVLVLEFKVGESQFHRSGLNQVWDYALDLKNFHSASHTVPIVPILIATDAPPSETSLPIPAPDGVYPPVRVNADGLSLVLKLCEASLQGPPIDAQEWSRAPYRPTPTIVEAAQALFANHSVDAITRSEAGARNLSETNRCVEGVIEEAQRSQEKAIVFVTGVPGAGKTLAGLNIATKRRDARDITHAVFLSGNGPLVAVLRAALVRDEHTRARQRGEKMTKTTVGQQVKAFIQNVHHFRDAGLNDPASPPADHVVIFDEAQRAWNREMTAHFMKQRKGVSGFHQSEPEFLLSYLDRHPDWAVVVCLVGGGQEINRGEAGISAWLDATREKYPTWKVFISPQLTDSEYAAGHALERIDEVAMVRREPSLHLAVSLRSFRAEKVSRFVKAVLDCELGNARSLLADIEPRYPIAVTRDLHAARRWIRQHARGSERYGLVTSSGALRLKPHAIDVRASVDPVQWFLNDADDTRSSYYLEDAATEFQVQGLELDWVCVAWDADLRFASGGWDYNSFRGYRWERVKKAERRQYLLNAYRVLLTRARQGMVVFIPDGDPDDPTRPSEFYDRTFEYLREIGIPEVVR